MNYGALERLVSSRWGGAFGADFLAALAAPLSTRARHLLQRVNWMQQFRFIIGHRRACSFAHSSVCCSRQKSNARCDAPMAHQCSNRLAKWSLWHCRWRSLVKCFCPRRSRVANMDVRALLVLAGLLLRVGANQQRPTSRARPCLPAWAALSEAVGFRCAPPSCHGSNVKLTTWLICVISRASSCRSTGPCQSGITLSELDRSCYCCCCCCWVLLVQLLLKVLPSRLLLELLLMALLMTLLTSQASGVQLQWNQSCLAFWLSWQR